MDDGSPIPYLVNPQSDTTLPIHACQTTKRAIGFNRSTDYWGDDAALQQHPPWPPEHQRCTFLHADGQRTAASSEASAALPARWVGFENAEVLRQRALDTIRKEAAAEEQGAEKQGDREERMMRAMHRNLVRKRGQLVEKMRWEALAPPAEDFRRPSGVSCISFVSPSNWNSVNSICFL